MALTKVQFIMNRQELQKISKIRKKEAHTLLKAEHYPGAYYLIGYAIECALKACIAKQTKKWDFPDKKTVENSYNHDLTNVLGVSGLKQELETEREKNNVLDRNWAIAKDWNESKRYDTNITKAEAKDLYSACTSRTNGILTWIKKRW